MLNANQSGNRGASVEPESEVCPHINAGGTVLTGRNDVYAYDEIGNRTGVTHNGNSAAYTPNNLNQYTQRVVPGYFDVAGMAKGSTVTVSRTGGPTNTASRHGKYFFDAYALPNGSLPIFDFLDIADNYVPPETGEVAAYLPKTPEAFTYDLDGNLTRDGRWVYEYDAENRLVTMYTRGAPEDPNDTVQANIDVWTSGILQQKLVFVYDYLGRRVQKTSYVWDSSDWDTNPVATKYVYNGWNLIAELNATSLALNASYTWGLDLSGSIQGAGGVGGLLMIEEDGDTFLPAYDAMGNLHALMTAAAATIDGTSYSAGDIVAAYEYDAFGRTIRESEAYAAYNPFRFSTKYTDVETSLVYYGHRYYSPDLGRFINRDPIEEQGGVNLYSFVRNNAVNAWDYLGMDAFMTTIGGLDGSPAYWIEGDGMTLEDFHNQSVAAANSTETQMAAGMALGAAIHLSVALDKASKGDFSWLAMYDEWGVKNGSVPAIEAAQAEAQAAQERLDNGETVKIMDASGNVREYRPEDQLRLTYGGVSYTLPSSPNSTGALASGGSRGDATQMGTRMDVPGDVRTLINTAVPAVVAARARNEESQTEYGTFGYRTKDGALDYTWVGPGTNSRSYNPQWDLNEIKIVGGTPLVLIHGHVWPDYRPSSFEDQDYARGLIPGTTQPNPNLPNGTWVVTVRQNTIEVINPTGHIIQEPMPAMPKKQ